MFVLFLGLLNHWVTLIAHKEPTKTSPNGRTELKTRLYLLDSTNKNFYFQPDEDIQHLVHQRRLLGQQITGRKVAPFVQ